MTPHTPTSFQASSLPSLRFGWNNSDNRPKDYHFHVNEPEIPDYFEGVASLEELKQAESLQPTEAIIEKAVQQFKDTQSPRFFMLEIPDSLGLSSKAVEVYYSSLLRGMISPLQGIKPWNEAELKRSQPLRGSYEGSLFTDTQREGIVLARTLNTEMATFLARFKEAKHRLTSLHWDTDGNVKEVPFLALIHGVRQNLQEDSALNIVTDFNQWYTDQGFQKSVKDLKDLNDLKEEQLALLLLDNSQELEDNYTVTMPVNDKSERLTVISNSPQHGGLFHGITPPAPSDDEESSYRSIRQSFLFDSRFYKERK